MNTSSGKTVAKGPDFDRRSGMRGLRPGERIVAKSVGLYRFLTRGPARVSLRAGMIEVLEPASDVTEIPIGSVDALSVHRTWFRSRLTVRLDDGTGRSIGGLDERDARRIRDAAYIEAARLASALCRRLFPLDKQLHRFQSGDRYVRHSDVCEFHAALTPVIKQCRGLVQKYLNREAWQAHSRLAPFETAGKLEAARERANDRFIAASIPKVHGATSTDPISDEQAEAVATDEDVTLVLAGAGTGKTRVVAGKVAHLVQNEAVQPQEILVLAFNNKAAENIRDRLRGDLATTEVTVTTFHAFGRSVIARAEERAPTISNLARDDKKLTQEIDGIIKEILQDDRESRALIDFVANHLTPYRPAYDFDTPAEYKEYIRNAELRTLSGDLVKSLEELAIANFLTEKGIEHEYEKPYAVSTATKKYGQYRPDFFLPCHNIWIEHFALDKSGQPPRGWPSYLEGVEWKRRTHEKHGTRLIETYSWQHEEGVLLETLQAKLEEAGVEFNPIPHEELVKKLARHRISRLAGLLMMFLNHVKTNGLTLDELRSRVRGDQRRNECFLDVFEQVHERYGQLLVDEKALDFHDLINCAASHIREGRWKHSYRYVLVDEFQDISAGRMALLQSIRRRNVAYFLVGDDWQSIYRFAGSDVGLLRDCDDFLGHVKMRILSQTFRFGDRIGGPSTAFVRRNPEQTQRTLRPKPGNGVYDHGICIVADGDPGHAIQDINTKTGGETPSVLVLGRYNDSKKSLPGKWMNCFSTVHKAKGLEEDYAVVLDLKNDRRGFPSQIEDDPLLELVLPSAGEGAYPFAEERRLFYVAMTRARRGVYLVTDPERPSAFVLELLRESGDLQKIGEFPPTGPSCPRCLSGHLVPSKTLKNLRCTNYPYCRHLAPRCPGCKVGYAVIKDQKTCVCTNPACSFHPMVCPECHIGVLEQKHAKFGPFLGCSEFKSVPPCFYTKDGLLATMVDGGIPDQ